MRWIFVLLALVLAFISAHINAGVSAPPEEAASASQSTSADPQKAQDSDPLYLRVAKTEDNKPQALQTAIVRYRGKPGTEYADQIVDLVGVVHIGQREYYEQLNKRLGRYDTVLYELVAPDGTRIRPEDLQQRRSILSSMQSGMKD